MRSEGTKGKPSAYPFVVFVVTSREMTSFVYSPSARQKLTEAFEGLKLSAYIDARKRLTIGYGHTGQDVFPGLTWTRQQADAALSRDIVWASDVVNMTVTYPIVQNEFDALVDFVFNVGAAAFEHSTMFAELNAGDLEGAAAQFPRWDTVSGTVVAGLLRRRIAEQSTFEEVA